MVRNLGRPYQNAPGGLQWGDATSASQRLSRHCSATGRPLAPLPGPLTSVILSKFAASQVDALMLLSDPDE